MKCHPINKKQFLQWVEGCTRCPSSILPTHLFAELTALTLGPTPSPRISGRSFGTSFPFSKYLHFHPAPSRHLDWMPPSMLLENSGIVVKEKRLLFVVTLSLWSRKDQQALHHHTESFCRRKLRDPVGCYRADDLACGHLSISWVWGMPLWAWHLLLKRKMSSPSFCSFPCM